MAAVGGAAVGGDVVAGVGGAAVGGGVPAGVTGLAGCAATG